MPASELAGWLAQSVEIALGVGLMQLLLQMLGVLVGAVVVYQALRGYRRNDSRPMLFLGAGLLVLGPVHFVFTLAPGDLVVVALGVELLDVLGLLLVLYSLTRA